MPNRSNSLPENTRVAGSRESVPSVRSRKHKTRAASRDVQEEIVDRLKHELGVHQVELELQNEQLRATQLALEASRDRYRDLYEDAPVGYVTFNVAGAIVEANRLATSLFALPHSLLVGRRIVELVAAEDRHLFQHSLRKLLAGRGAQRVELRLAHGAIAPCWVAMEMKLATEANESPHCGAVLIDVTERVRMQEEVRRLAAIVSSSEDAIISRDLKGRITAWNAAAANLFGLEAKEMLGKTMDALVPPERRAEDEGLLTRLRQGKTTAHLESERLKRDGSTVSLSMSISAVHDDANNIIGQAMIARDISARRRMERALHDRMRQLDMLSQAGQTLILGHRHSAMRGDLFGRLVTAVRAEIHLDYASTGDSGELSLLSASGLPEDELNRLKQGPAEALCEHAAARSGALVIDDLPNCDLTHVAWFKSQGARCVVACPLKAHGRFYGVASFASTTRDRFPQGDLFVIQSVCDQVASILERDRLLEELYASEQSLKLIDRMKDDFIATLAHELRNPLAPIRNAVSILRRSERLDRGRIEWCRDIIDRQVEQMARLLEDLLDVSRLTRNTIVLRRDRMEIKDALEQAVEATQPLLEAMGHRLRMEVPDEPITLHGDLTRLTQVFANLLNNAAKYSDEGATIVVNARREGDWVRIGIRDTGIGIAPVHLENIFDMFSQIVPALERSHGGLGIGLALTRGLVELHGGTVQAFSEGLGRGSEFVVRLPASQSARAAEERAARPIVPAAAGSSSRLIIADDNADAVQSLASLMRLCGHDVRTALGGIEALRIVEEWRPEVAILDIGMHDLNGYELCRRIRSLDWERRPLLIACTGWGQAADKARALEAGFDHHIIKPVAAEALLDLIADRDAH